MLSSKKYTLRGLKLNRENVKCNQKRENQMNRVTKILYLGKKCTFSSFYMELEVFFTII
jgi:hypothetical protein